MLTSGNGAFYMGSLISLKNIPSFILNLSNTKRQTGFNVHFTVTMYSCMIIVKSSIIQAANMVGNLIQRNTVDRVLFSAPERVILDRAGLSTVTANTKREEFLPFKRRKNIIFLSSNHLEKKLQVDILKAYISQKGQKLISDLWKTPS